VPRFRLVLALVALAWLTAAAPAAAQERQELSLGSGDEGITVLADRVENRERDRLLIAEGQVEIEQGDIRVQADRVEVNTETGEAVAVGRVVLFDGRDRLVGDRLEYNFRSGTGIVYQAEGAVEPHFFFAGERMERFGDKAYRITRGVFTTCEDEDPAWSVRLGSATAYLDDWLYGRNASFWVWKLPLVPFIPVFAASLRKDRHTGLLAPTLGNSSEKGFIVQQPFFWAISDSQDLTLVPTYYGKKGFGLGGSYRYIRTETSRGELEGFFLRDTQVHDERWVIGFRHEEQVTPRLSFQADVAQVSDDDYFDEFGGTLDERSRQRLESNVWLTQRWEKWNFVGRLYWYEDLLTDKAVELQRLPDLRLSAFQQPLPWFEDALYELESSYTNFVRDIGSDGQRLDIRPALSYPFSPGGYLTLTPRVGFRETIYDTKVVGTRIEQGFIVEDTRSEFLSRTLFESAVDVEARAFRNFDVNGALGIQRLQHTIEPRVTYNFVEGDDGLDVPQWDATDTAFPTNNITYSLTTRLKARAVGEEDRPGRVWELGRFAVSQTWEVAEPAELPPPTFGAAAPTVTNVPGKRLSNIFADLILEPLWGLRFRGTANFDPYDTRGIVANASLDASYYARDWGVNVGTRHGERGELQFVQANAEARIGRRWSFRFQTNYDTVTDTVIENRFEVTFREQCWAISAGFIERTDEDEFRVTVNLLELGQWGFGRAFGTSQ
jgi:LPS-assembly protein